MMNINASKPVVMGLGNPLFQDEGLGIHVISRLLKLKWAERVELIDGGTEGLSLLNPVEAAEYLLVIDAIDGGFQPGTVKLWNGSQIPFIVHQRTSLHQLGFQEVLALARMRGTIPEQMLLVGVQPRTLEWGTQLTPEVAGSVPLVIDIVYQQINRWSWGQA
ncbi:MAG: HyaD/HybD family hydrogenase maturation endopeptidase [Syntrophomonas sp.]|nr:HyaD/HybD family hydrogenase maturation endopeptidase [Syntrophomonas sp.]